MVVRRATGRRSNITTNPPQEEEESNTLVIRHATGRSSNPPAAPRRSVRAKRPATRSGTPSRSKENNTGEKRGRASLEEPPVEEQSETQRAAKRTRKG